MTTNTTTSTVTGDVWSFAVISGDLTNNYLLSDDWSYNSGGTGAALSINNANSRVFLKSDMIYHMPSFLASAGFPLTVKAASLHIHARSNGIGFTDLTLSQVSDTSWTEETLTASTMPAIGSTIGSLSSAVTPGQWLSFDITSALAAPATGGSSPAGFDSTASKSPVAFALTTATAASKQWLDARSTNDPPYIAVTFSVPAQATCN